MRKICFTCDLLGDCDIATLDMLLDDEGCGSWKEAEAALIRARERAKAVAGPSALKSMLIKNPLKQSRR